MSDKTTELQAIFDALRFVLKGCRRTESAGFDTYWISADALDASLDKIEQAIAATLGSDAKLCYATDYTHEHCKYSTNRGWVENVAHGTLTAEQVRELMKLHSRQYQSLTDAYVWLTEYDWQAIADELNAAIEGEECEWHAVRISGNLEGYECECGQMLPNVPRFCPNCGRKAVKR